MEDFKINVKEQCMHKYELVVLFKPLLFEDLKNGAISKINSFISKAKGNMTETDNIGKKLLAYPIKDFKEGYYVEYSVEIDSAKAKELERELNLEQDVLRFLLTRQK